MFVFGFEGVVETLVSYIFSALEERGGFREEGPEEPVNLQMQGRFANMFSCRSKQNIGLA